VFHTFIVQLSKEDLSKSGYSGYRGYREILETAKMGRK
jgi:hypothetical protein